MAAAQEVTRWQLDVPAARGRELDAFIGAYGFSTRKDLVNTAMSFLQWAIEEVKGGRIIASLDERNMRYKQIDLPAFKIAAGHSTQSGGVAEAAKLLGEAAVIAEVEGSPVLRQKVQAAQAAISELAA